MKWDIDELFIELKSIYLNIVSLSLREELLGSVLEIHGEQYWDLGIRKSIISQLNSKSLSFEWTTIQWSNNLPPIPDRSKAWTRKEAKAEKQLAYWEKLKLINFIDEELAKL